MQGGTWRSHAQTCHLGNRWSRRQSSLGMQSTRPAVTSYYVPRDIRTITQPKTGNLIRASVSATIKAPQPHLKLNERLFLFLGHITNRFRNTYTMPAKKTKILYVSPLSAFYVSI
jgi:hypothetical protein